MNEQAQSAQRLLMVRPACFGFNPQTAESNAFQQTHPGSSADAIARDALEEFDAAVGKLQNAGVEVFVVDDVTPPHRPDAVFPNNWLVTFPEGLVVTCPMQSEIRRQEVRDDILDELTRRFVVNSVWRLERETAVDANAYLEGTGSLVLDRQNRIAWACRSPRTDPGLVRLFCQRVGFEPVLFDAVDAAGKPIYHTNVMMAVTSSLVVVCLEAVRSEVQRARVGEIAEQLGLASLEISLDQVSKFAGNVLEVSRASDRGPIIVLSSTALAALKPVQRRRLERGAELVELAIPTIEQAGGGSVRCMLAELFLPERDA